MKPMLSSLFKLRLQNMRMLFHLRCGFFLFLWAPGLVQPKRESFMNNKALLLLRSWYLCQTQQRIGKFHAFRVSVEKNTAKYHQFEVNPVFRAKAEETVTLSSVNEYKFDCMDAKENFRELDHHHQPIWQCVKLSKCKIVLQQNWRQNGSLKDNFPGQYIHF